MSVKEAGEIWEAYFRGELPVQEAAQRLAALDGSVDALGFALPDVPDALERAEELTLALVAALQRAGP